MSSPRTASEPPRRQDTRTPPRKKPHCTHCGSPMLGHKRGQCHLLTTPIAKYTKVERVDLVQGLLELQLQSDDTEKTQIYRNLTPRKQALEKAETLLSLSPDDKTALDGLKMPGMFEDRSVDGDGGALQAGIQTWLEAVPITCPYLPFKASVEPISPSQHDLRQSYNTVDNSPPSLGSKAESAVSSAGSLGRTSSMEERREFLMALAEKSRKPVASVFTIAMSDIHELEKNAKKLKLQARIIAPKYADGTTGDGWLVIGREGRSVDQVFEGVERDVKNGVGSITTVVRNGAMGAVAAWLYLAFS